jgi:hypothetical protein
MDKFYKSSDSKFALLVDEPGPQNTEDLKADVPVSPQKVLN